MKPISAHNFILLLITTGMLFFSCDDKEGLEGVSNQVYIKLFGGVGSEEGHDLIQLQDGGFVIVGATSSYSEDDKDVFLVRTDQNGNEIWSKRYGDSLNNEGKSVMLSDNGNLVICGHTTRPNGRRDILILETDLSGNEINSATYGTLNQDEYGVQIIKAISTGYMILGTNAYGNPVDPDSSFFYLLEVDEGLVAKPNRNRPSIGVRSRKNIASSVMNYNNQEYLCFGTTEGGGTNAPAGSENFYLFKIPEIGGATNTTNFLGTELKEHGTSIARVSGGYLLVGYQINNADRNMPYLVKVSDGLGQAPLWENVLDVPYNNSQISRMPTSVIETSDGNYLMLMNSNVPPFGTEIGLMKVDFSGQTVIWETNFGSNNNDRTSRVIEQEDGRLVMCGSIGFGEENNEPVNKMGLFKTNPMGELIPIE